MREPYFDGYIELHNGGGIHTLQIYFEDERHIDVYINDIRADDVDSKAYLADEYGDRFYYSLGGFKVGEWLAIDEIWPEGAS